MVSSATKVKFKVLDSELEALLVEAELIRTYQPQFNILLKDDKSPLYIKITDEKFPKVIRLRKKQIIHGGKKEKNEVVLGPFSSAQKTQEVLKIVRKIFPWCNKKASKSNRPCFYYHIDQCPGACVGEISQDDYMENINQLILFLKGEKKTVSKNLKEKLKEKIDREEFEDAAVIRDQLEMIEFVTKKTHKLEPELTTQALKNRISEDGIIYLQKIISSYMGLPKTFPLTRIEGYDVSNTQGTNPAVSMVAFIDGVASSSDYRLFNIRTLDTPNDYQMMKEALSRRQNNAKWGIPNLVVIDGGKGQVRAVLNVWHWATPVIGIAKNPDRLILPIVKWEEGHKNTKGLEYHIVKLSENHPSLNLIQQIRDEAHRFSQFQHKRTRMKKMFN